MRYRVTEGGLEPNAISQGVLGEFSARRARRVTSRLTFRRRRLGTMLSFSIVSDENLEFYFGRRHFYSTYR